MKKKLSTVIICRANAPLVKCLFDLIKTGRRIKARIVGRDIAATLKDVVGEVLDRRRNCSIEEFVILLDGWIERLRSKFKEQERYEDALSESEDSYACISVMCQEVDDARGLYSLIDSYIISENELTDDPSVLVLTTAHRVKGLEYERAVVIRADMMPSSKAETEADRLQEEHLMYVAFTRGMHELIVCHDKNPE